VFEFGGALLRLSAVEGWTPHAHTVFGFALKDMSATVKALTARGVEFIVYPGFGQDANGGGKTPDGNLKVAWLNDPDGNSLSLTEVG
jgi:hypothetical protein